MSMSAEVDQDARKLVKSLYAAMEGKPMQWQMVTGLSSKQAAVDYAVENVWLLVEDGRSVCLTEEGCGASPNQLRPANIRPQTSAICPGRGGPILGLRCNGEACEGRRVGPTFVQGALRAYGRSA
jgi:hypothetical protein